MVASSVPPPSFPQRHFHHTWKSCHPGWHSPLPILRVFLRLFFLYLSPMTGVLLQAEIKKVCDSAFCLYSVAIRWYKLNKMRACGGQCRSDIWVILILLLEDSLMAIIPPSQGQRSNIKKVTRAAGGGALGPGLILYIKYMYMGHESRVYVLLKSEQCTLLYDSCASTFHHKALNISRTFEIMQALPYFACNVEWQEVSHSVADKTVYRKNSWYQNYRNRNKCTQICLRADHEIYW